MTETETNAPSPKADRATLSRELSNFLIEFSIALNKHGMYPLGHPALEPTAGAVQRRLELLLTTDDTLSLGVARKQLVIEGVATDPSSPVLAELAAKLHRHHLGAVTFQSGTTAEEIREVLQLIALEPDRMDDPLGLGAPERLTQWLHIVLHPVNYGRLELLVDGEGDEEERERSAARVRASQLWIGLAQAAIAAEEARDEESVGYEIDHDPSAVAKAINDRPRTSAYDQVIVGYLLQMGEELRAGQGEEDAELRKRMSKLIADLDSTTLQGLLSMGGDHTQRRNFLLNATQGLAAEVVVELVKAAGEAEEQTVSHSLLRVLQKLAQHAEQGEGRRRAEADLALREQVRALISDWALRDPNPEGYRLTLSRVAEAKSVFAAYTDTRYAPEPRRIIEMALEADVIPRNYHQMEDVAEALDMECVIRSADFAVAVAVAWLRGEADPLAIV